MLLSIYGHYIDFYSYRVLLFSFHNSNNTMPFFIQECNIMNNTNYNMFSFVKSVTMEVFLVDFIFFP
jgi:hypothetical protein